MVSLNLLNSLLAGTTQVSATESNHWLLNMKLLTLILVILTLIMVFFIVLPYFRRKQFDVSCKPIGKISPEDFYVGKPQNVAISEENYIQAFVSRPEDKNIRDAIGKGQSVLILGKPMQVKERFSKSL